MARFDLPEQIIGALRRLEIAGHAAYLVGGCVRDMVMGKAPHDWDAASSATPEQVARLFRKTVMTGERFGTVKVPLPGFAVPAAGWSETAEPGGAYLRRAEDTGLPAADNCFSVEVTTFRTDGEYRDGRRPENVAFTSRLREDLSRRDFTMNAMALSADGGLIDPLGGWADIEKRVIRCVGDADTRFKEDALRMFRAFRFSAELGFGIEPQTLSAIDANAGGAHKISAERIRVELEKTLISQRPEIAGEMIKAGLLARFLTGSAGEMIPEPFFRARAAAGTTDAQIAARCWSVFTVGLLGTGAIHSASDFLHAMKLDSKTIRDVTAGTEILSDGFPSGRAEIKRLMSTHGKDAVLCAAVCLGDAALSETEAVIASGECYSIHGLAVSGRDLIDLGHQPGRELGETLRRLFDHVVEHPEDNTREILLKLALG